MAVRATTKDVPVRDAVVVDRPDPEADDNPSALDAFATPSP